MQSEHKFFMGVDVSKHWIDMALMQVVNHQRQPLLTHRFDNTRAGMAALGRWLVAQGVSFDHHSLLVIENTGVYHRLLWEYCTENNLPLHIGNAAQIKWSQGIARGKSDGVDSKRLCTYAYRNGENLQATPLHTAPLVQLKDLLRARTRLINQKNSIRVYLGELAHGSSPEMKALMEQAHQAALDGIAASIKTVESEIKAAIAADDALQQNYRLLVSVPGLGHITAVYLLCCTHNFALRPTGKQLACYAGVAPFGHCSGTSIRGRDRVHPMANKELKKLLHMGAVSVIGKYQEFRDYYQRKCREGKHPLAVLNAIRNKIALRAAAVIMKQKPYVSPCANTLLHT